ncbi:MAG: alpha/beta hydrolase, partial [Myxococcales bacterium]|nr:alpha/beta hydrolase [Myxococcales bacterium]
MASPSSPPPSADTPVRAFPAGGGASLRWRRLEVPGARALILVLGGRGEPLEKYAEVERELVARGLEPWNLEWRGQGGSDRAPGLEGLGHVETFATYLDDLRAFVD